MGINYKEIKLTSFFFVLRKLTSLDVYKRKDRQKDEYSLLASPREREEIKIKNKSGLSFRQDMFSTNVSSLGFLIIS